MSQLSISLLGSPKIILEGVQVKAPTFRAIPLLAYLAITGVSQTREILASLLWSESNLPHALGSLRTTLWRLNSAGLGDWIILDRSEISLNYHKSMEIDVMDFKEKMHQCTTHGHPPSQICLLCISTLTEAVELYRGEFLYGINLSKAHLFDEWRMQQSEALTINYLDALEKLVRGHRTFGDFNLAIHYARKWLSQDRYNETVHHDLLQLYSITGQRAAAIDHYKGYKSFVSRELGIEPSDEITTLYKQILSGRTIASHSRKVKSPVILTADIEKVALYWSQAGIEKYQILFKYHNIFKETCQRFGGQILQESEDCITVLFENGQSLHCALTIHLKTKKTDWGSSDPPNIRMVLYSTTADDGHKNSFSTLTRAASNLLSISWGGQILVTEQTTRDVDLPPGSRFKDLGYHSLQESIGPVHVYELLHPQLPAIEHQPLQSYNPQLVNFPSPTHAFIGRVAVLNELSTLFESPDTRIISLVGPGGVGKTSLAIQFATHIANHFSDGAFFISLAPIQDPDLIPIILADALKFSFYGPRNLKEQLCDYLHRMNVLFVFDNFEHLRLEGAEFLAFLLNHTHILKILVTSRERLNLISETIMEVHGMRVPPSETAEDIEKYSSVMLFLQSAQRISPGLRLENNLSAIIRICQLVNGLPLGIILASSWVRVYSCPQIADEIKNNIDFLTTSAPDLAPRHRSLRAVFDSSWKLLTEEERLILSRLSIFRAAFTSHAAQEICAASPLSLAAFVNKSLLFQRQDDRYEMLETFHQFALSKLELIDEEFVATKFKFVDYYANFCIQKNQALNAFTQRQALDELISEIENIRISWNWMIDLERWDLIDKVKQPLLTFHAILGNFVQGKEFFRLALNKLNNLNDQTLVLIRASMQQHEAWMTIRIGYITEGLQGLSASLDIFRQYNSLLDIIMSMMFLADANRILGNIQQGKKYISDTLQLIRGIELPKINYVIAIIAHCQYILGMILIELGDFNQAELNLESCLLAHQKIGTHYGTIFPLQGLAKLAYFRGEYAKSRDLYLQALDIATSIYERHAMALIHNYLGDIYETLASPIESYHHVLTAINLCKETGDLRLTAIILNNLAYHNSKYLRLPSEAIRMYHESIDIFSDLGDLRGITYTFYDLSKAYLQVGLVEEALSYCIKSLQTAITLDSTPLILHAMHGFANLYAYKVDHERALRLCYLIENNPQIEPDTQKRVMVTRIELEANSPPEVIETANKWVQSTSLQDAIDLILSNNY
jgi:predicted ATPase/DNA-binding SARP family transcriptional activator